MKWNGRMENGGTVADLPIQHSHTELQVTLILKCTRSFDGNGASLQHRLMSLKLLYIIDAYNSSMAIFCPLSGTSVIIN